MTAIEYRLLAAGAVAGACIAALATMHGLSKKFEFRQSKFFNEPITVVSTRPADIPNFSILLAPDLTHAEVWAA